MSLFQTLGVDIPMTRQMNAIVENTPNDALIPVTGWSIFALLATALLTYIAYRYYRHTTKTAGSFFTAIRLLAIPIAMALIVQYTVWLVVYCKDLSHFAAFLQSIRHTAHTFAIEDTMTAVAEQIREAQEAAGGKADFGSSFTWWEQCYFALLMVLAPFSTISFALSLFRTPKFWVRFYTSRRTEVYFFSDLNERALIYARALMNANLDEEGQPLPGMRRPIMVFCTDEEQSENAVDAMTLPGAVVLRSSITNLFLWPMLAKMERVHFYLVTDDENRKVQQARELQSKYSGMGCLIRCVSAQQTNNHEVDALNKQSQLWDEEIESLKDMKKQCKLLVISTNRFDPAILQGYRGVTLVFGLEQKPPACWWQKKLICFRHSLDRYKWLIKRLSRRRWVAFCINSTLPNRLRDDAQFVHQLRDARGCRIYAMPLTRLPGDGPRDDEWRVPASGEAELYAASDGDEALEKQQKDAAKALRAADGAAHVLRFTSDGAPLDEENRDTAHHIDSSCISLLDEASSLVYVHLLRKGLFTPELLRAVYSQAPDKNGMRPFRVLVLGSGSIGEELTRVCLWYCQLPGMRSEVTVAGQDEEALISGRILRNWDSSSRAKTGEQDAWGSEIYRIDSMLPHAEDCTQIDRAILKVRGKIDFRTMQLESLLDEAEHNGTDKAGKPLPMQPYHAIFVCSGNDDLNYQLALRLRRYYLRREPDWGYPTIRVNIWNDMMVELLQRSDALRGVEKGKIKPDYRMRHADQTEGVHNPRCKVELFGSMSESIRHDQSMRFDALCYHAYYNEVSTLLDDTVQIPLEIYHSYRTSTENDHKSNRAVAIHGQCKCEWVRSVFAANAADVPQGLDALAMQLIGEAAWAGLSEDEQAQVMRTLTEASLEAILRELEQAEHNRWCIFKLLEGSTAVPEGDGLLSKHFYSDTNKKSRDPDDIRGYHAMLRTWDKMQEHVPGLKEGKPIEKKNWGDGYLSNRFLVHFSLKRGGLLDVNHRLDEHGHVPCEADNGAKGTDQ